MGNEESDVPPAQSTDRQDASNVNCEYCGTAIDTSDWYPVTKERDQDGSLRLFAFCSEDCQDAWHEEREE